MDIKELMNDALENIVDADLKNFKWCLWNGLVPDIERIPQSKLEKADRTDVVDRMVEKYSDQAGNITVQALRKIKQNNLAKTLESKLQGVLQSEPVDGGNTSVCVVDSETWKRPASVTQSSQEFKSRILRENKSDVYIPKEKSQRKRLALLITNIRFKHLPYRQGAERDEENMEWLLTALGYSVEKCTDLTGQEIADRVKNFAARSEHQDSDSTFVVMMSHGTRIENKDAISGFNYIEGKYADEFFFVDGIFSHLNSQKCPALINKPKVILIQACRGTHPGAVDVPDSAVHTVHIEKDFFCFKSCLPEIGAWRNSSIGSYFIVYIMEVFCKKAHVDDIMELFRKVGLSMEKDTRLSAYGTLMPCIDRTPYTKKLYLFPGL
ncbi:caspase b-like [Siphateles boraxobius]|uniref:caspase b-like n=1 Tax=Siphateles boraxobius TaxID=180520 RepID=UPI00406460AF